MYGRPASAPMRELLDLLNADFVSGQAIPKFARTDPTEAAHLQDWLKQYLAPILVTDPSQVAEQRRATYGELLRVAERRGWGGTREDLRRYLAQPPDVIKATVQRAREDGLRTLASELSEWAEEAKIYPRWQVTDNQIPDRRPGVPVERRYQGGKRVLSVSQVLPCPPTLKNFTMMNLGACLVSGEFLCMRVCAWVECGGYYCAGDLRQKCCSRECYRRRDNAGRKRRRRK